MLEPIFLAKLLVCLFFAGCFLQSGFDKVFDWGGNLGWLKGHFEKTPLKGLVPMMLGTVTLMEVAAGLGCAASIAVIILNGPAIVPVYSMGLVSLTLAFLFIGQRIAKDYVGAGVLATYFGVSLIGLILMASRSGVELR